MLSFPALLAVLTLSGAAVQATSGAHDHLPSARHAAHKRRAQDQSAPLSTRGLDPGPFLGGKGTWFNIEENEVDCGGYYKHTDFAVALNQGQYGNLDARSPYCNKWISITSNGKTAKAKVVDACPESSGACHWGALDMSTGLFQYFADLNDGVIDIQWHLLDDDGHDDPPSHPAPPKVAPPTVPTPKIPMPKVPVPKVPVPKIPPPAKAPKKQAANTAKTQDSITTTKGTATTKSTKVATPPKSANVTAAAASKAKQASKPAGAATAALKQAASKPHVAATNNLASMAKIQDGLEHMVKQAQSSR